MTDTVPTSQNATQLKVDKIARSTIREYQHAGVAQWVIDKLEEAGVIDESR